MLSVLFLIFLGYLLYKAFMLIRRFDAVRHQFRRQFDEAQQPFGNSQSGRPRYEKRYGGYEGEYVDYEEVPDTDPAEASTQVDTADPGARYHAGEELISDAEYEEI